MARAIGSFAARSKRRDHKHCSPLAQALRSKEVPPDDPAPKAECPPDPFAAGWTVPLYPQTAAKAQLTLLSAKSILNSTPSLAEAP
jgi:hypothetical protein